MINYQDSLISLDGRKSQNVQIKYLGDLEVKLKLKSGNTQ